MGLKLSEDDFLKAEDNRGGLAWSYSTLAGVYYTKKDRASAVL